jgi:hypothetical protein
MPEGHGEKLSRKREEAIAALLTESSVEAAARKAGLGKRTLLRWLATPSFASEYRRRRWALLDNATRLLQRASEAAVANLIQKLKAEKDSDSLRASEAILEWAFRASELTDLAGRVAALERQRDAPHEQPPPKG